ncbi:5-methyltetrahydropteroyltriglutamate--homocysteine S-methyltransferase [Marinomonas spartinae]|uniref:5-methyltetrahydropteroyltriglutamate-- homocysteine S-methyltransferase n=1 Tax=Marinomonas spartinae TaxID=1792290 RepID=UPI0018F240C5|nr:5-methyltetrahydropteroyltriglutamate--homocysteine S-methyltransferase [Marinomonas spartinae]MBJ7556528.1 5-methyltetrahydropteroyltriglutamate--homocysteine S-methyltransferase [Marinomonas spartinae]
MDVRFPSRSDVVGSYLRPEYLHQARRDFKEGVIDRAALTAVEDRAILELVEQQKVAGLKVITDGEFRRSWWHIDFLENLNGVEGYVPEAGYNQQFKGKDAPSYNIRVSGKVSFNPNHPFLAHFDFLKKATETGDESIAKATIPSPTMILRQEILANDGSSRLDEIYSDVNGFYHDLAQTYRDAIQAYYAHGCRYLQFDDTNWAFLVDADKRDGLVARGIDPDKISDICTQIINQSLAGKPDDLVITTHICRGNHASSWLFSGGYEPVAKALFATHYDGFFLEYDNDRAGDFAPLRYCEGKEARIVLGLVTSKFPELEDPELIKARIKEASDYVPLENLCISPQCGFASTAEGNKLAIDDQWNKIRLLNRVADQVWAS